jgi:hypothetical protein
LLVFVRYLFQNTIEENLLLCKSLKSRATGEEIFKVINSYIIGHDISWGKCVDGGRAMTRKTAGVVACIKELALSCSNSHCVFHRQALVRKTMEKDLKTLLDDALKIVN